jgi:DNA polymerase-4
MKIHIDLDCFFVSAERTRDPSLQNRPVGIGGRGDQQIFARQSGRQTVNLDNSGSFVGTFFHAYDTTQSDMEKFTDPDGRVRGILTTASYEARAYGIRTGTTIREALQKCPRLIVRAPDMKLYQQLSRELHAFLQQRIPVIEQASIDEFYGDLGGWVADEEVPWFIDMLRHEIKRCLDLPVSIGAAQTKSIAKLATGTAKPFGCRTVTPEELPAFIENIPVAAFPGIGRSMQRRLSGYRIETLGELLHARSLVESWGPYARELYRRVSGSDRTEVVPDHVRKSIGISRTFDPLRDRGEMRRRVIILARHLAYAVMRIGVIPTTFHVGIRYEMHQSSHANITENRLFSEKWFKDLVLSLFYRADTHRELAVVRLSIHCSHFTHISRRELSLLHFDEDRVQHRLSEQTQAVREKYGLDMLKWGSEMGRP